MANPYETLIPDELYHACIPTDGKHNFLYIGRKSIAAMRDVWKRNAEAYAKLGEMADVITTRMMLMGEAQYSRTRARKLEELMTDADDKPSIFRELPTEPLTRLTCALPETNGAYVDCVLMSATKNEKGDLVYEVKVTDKRQRFAKITGMIRFRPDLFSVIPTEDWHYLKCHPNFFRLYLGVCANSPCEEKRVEKILAVAS